MSSAFVLLLAANAITLAPLHVEHGATVVQLRADGTIFDGAGVEIGQVEGNTVRIGESTWFRVDDAGVVHAALFHDELRFDDDDALSFTADGKRRRYFIDEDGVFANEGALGDVHRTGAHISGVTRASRRAAVLMVLTADLLERFGPPPRPHRVTFSLDLFSAFAAYFDVVSELRINRPFSLALHAGGGSRLINPGPNHSTTLAWEAGLEPRWYTGVLRSSVTAGLYLAWSTRFARGQKGVLGFESLQPPPGLSSGLLAGWKTDFWAVTVDVSAGALFPLVTFASEVSHPPAAFVVRFGVGFSL